MSVTRAPTIDFSVIIATYNRAGLLRETLSHIARQQVSDYRWEVVVIDNGDTQDTRAVLADAAASLPLVALREATPGKSRALNRGLASARGELIVFTDDDVVPRPGWLAELVAASQRWPLHSIFGGPILPLFPAGAPGWIQHHPLNMPTFAEYSLGHPEGPLPFETTAPFGPNFAVRARLLATQRFRDDLGPRGDSYVGGEETELLWRLRSLGESIVYVPSAGVQHVIRPEQLRHRWLMDKAFRVGIFDVQFIERDSTSARVFGVPRYLWRSLATEGLAYAASMPRGGRARFDTGFRFFRRLGQVREYQRSADIEGATLPASLVK